MDIKNILTEGWLKKFMFKLLHPVQDIKNTYAKLQKDRKMKAVMNDPDVKKAWKNYEKAAKEVSDRAQKSLDASGFSNSWQDY